MSQSSGAFISATIFWKADSCVWVLRKTNEDMQKYELMQKNGVPPTKHPFWWTSSTIWRTIKACHGMSSQDQWTPWVPDQTLLQQVRVKHCGVRRHALQFLPGKIQTVPNASSVCGSPLASQWIINWGEVFRRYKKLFEKRAWRSGATCGGPMTCSCSEFASFQIFQ